MINDIQNVCFTKEQIAERVKELGETITKDYAGKKPILVGALTGCFIFMADLCREINLKCDIEFMSVSSYGSGTESSGEIKIKKDLSADIAGRDVIIIEDILDTGRTLFYLKKYLQKRDPASIKICTLLDKQARREADISADYVGFDCPDGFVVGYGLDFDGRYRNLPIIGILKPELYS